MASSYDRVQDGVESFAGLFGNEAASTLELTTRAAKGIPGVSSILSAAQGGYHAGAAVYDGITGDRDGAVSHGAQSFMGFAGAIPGVSQAMGTVDQALGLVGGSARLGQGMAGKPDEGIEPGDIPASVTDIVSSAAVGATNSIFGADDSNWFADGSTPQGSRAGEIESGVMGMSLALGAPLGPLGLIASGLSGAMGGEALTSLLGSDTKPGTTSGAKPGLAAQTGRDIHDVLGPEAGGAIGGGILGGLALGPMGLIPGILGGMSASSVDQQLEAAQKNGGIQLPAPTPSNPTPLVPGTPGFGGGSGPGPFEAGKNSGGSPGTPSGGAGAAGGGAGPGGQLIGPGGLAGPSAAEQVGYGYHVDYTKQPPPAAPGGPMPYGVQPKGNGAPMSGPMPKLPWFLEPAGPSTW